MPSFKIGVVGGSLGGLTAGCLLSDAGHDVTIFERTPRELEERGAGIGLLEATARYPVRHGAELDRISVRTEHIRYLNRDGSVGFATRHPYLFSSWNTIYRELLGCFDSERYRLGYQLVDFERSDDEVAARFSNGQTFTCDLLVGADGIGSAVRSRLQPEAGIRYAGYVAWRGMVPESMLPVDLVTELADAVSYHVMANSHILVYPIPNVDGAVAPGDRLLNFVWYRNYLEGGELDDLLTDSRGQRREMSVPPGSVAEHHVDEMRATARARLPGPLEAVVSAVEQPFLQIIYDIEVDRMAFGNVCLIGDAAFAVRPHAAAGTAKAADDAWTLTDALSGADSVKEALESWEPKQLALGRELGARSNRVGSHSQVTNTWDPTDPECIFGLHQPGD